MACIVERAQEMKVFCFFSSEKKTLAWLIFAAIALAPFCLVQVPGLGDYLNHLARMHVLVSIGHSADLQRYYQVHWTPIPYLAMDAVVPVLAQVFPIYLAGKLFVLACVVLPVVGTACLHYAVHRRLSVVPLAAWLVSANMLLAFGFLNYLFSLGFALMLFAAWISTAGWPRWPRAAIFAPAVLALYFGHAFACGAYCLAVAGFETSRAVRGGMRRARAVAADLLAAFAQAAPALLFAAMLDVNAGYVGRLQTHWGSVPDKLFALASPFLFLHDGINGGVMVVAFMCAGWLATRVRLAREVWPACIVVAVAAAAMPHVVASTWGMDLRLPLFLVLLLIGGASFPRAPTWRWPALAVLVILLGVKSADAWVVLRRLDGQIAETRHILDAIPRGARLLVVNVRGHGTGQERVPVSTIWHMPLVAVIDRDAFVPYLFNGLTTVRVRPAFRFSSTPNGLPVTPAQLRDGQAAETPATDVGDGKGARDYWLGWPKNFDYVLIQRFGDDPGKLPTGLHLVAGAADMDLYQVSR
jgi:hypothetical protein